MNDALELYLRRSLYFNGAEIATAWTDQEREAWAGFVAYTARLFRAHSRRLHATHELSFSMIGLLGCLEAAENHAIRLTDLAAAMDLSLARVSRIVDILEKRGLVERARCLHDARATNAVLTPAGVAAARTAQATSGAAVRRDFLDPLTEHEIALLAHILERLTAHLEHDREHHDDDNC